MALIGGSSSRKTENFEQFNNQQDRRQVGSDASVVTQGKFVRVNNTADEAVELADINADLLHELSDDVTGAFRSSVGLLNDLSDDFTGLGRDVIDGSFRAIGDVSSDAANLSKSSLDFVRDSSGENFDFLDRRAGATEDFTLQALQQLKDNREQAFDFAGNSLGQVSNALTSTLAESQEDSTQLATQLIRIGIPAAALVLMVWAFRK